MRKLVKNDIVDTLRDNYMPYAVSVALDRALPEIDGFKPSHRKILWTMYEMSLLNGNRTKSANIVGSVMKYNPHGDQAIYETMVRLAQGDTLLFPYVLGKGNFGQHTSKLLQPASSRYTEAKLSEICEEMFKGIKKDAVDFVPNYDNTRVEPRLLPTTFPNVLVNNNLGIAVGMASSMPSFNLKEVCQATIAYMKDSKCDLTETLLAPDFATGGIILYDQSDIARIYENGLGSIKIRSKYRYNAKDNAIEVYEIPYTTTREDIINKVVDLVKNGDMTDISDIEDLTDLKGMKISISLKKGKDPDAVMQKLFVKTPLQDSFSCNFNLLINGRPQVLGVRSIIGEWVKFRIDNLRRQTLFDMRAKEKELGLLEGLHKVQLDIDKAIEIIRGSKNDEAVIKNLVKHFGITEEQAEYVANIRLRDLNKDYLLNKTKNIEKLKAEIKVLKSVAESDAKIKSIIANQLEEVIKKYGTPRKSTIEYGTQAVAVTEEIPNYNVMFFLTKEGYFKKITLTSLRSSGEHKLKDGDQIIRTVQGQNIDEVLVFTNVGNVYRIKAHKVEDGKTSNLGMYLPTELGLKDESIIDIVVTSYTDGESVLNFYKNGFIARVDIKAYQSNYTVLKGNLQSEIIKVEKLTNDIDVMLITTEGKGLIFNTNEINTISSRNAKGVKGIAVTGDIEVASVILNPESKMQLAITTKKKGTFNEKSADYAYYEGSRGNVGVFLYNCRKNGDVLLNVERL